MDGKIIEEIVAKTEPVMPAPPWAFLPPSASVVQFVGDQREIAQKLQTAIGENPQLLSILASDASGEPVLGRVLTGENFLVVRQEKNGAPTDLVNGRGRLVNGEPPALHWSEDAVTRSGAAKLGFVLVAFSDADAAALRWLGLPVTPAYGLDTLSADQAKRLLTEPTPAPDDELQPDSPRPSPTKRPKLILVALDLFGLRHQMPQGVLLAVNQFRSVERMLKLNTASSIGIWLSDHVGLREIRDAVHLSDRSLVVKAITASVNRSTMSVAEYLKATAAPPANGLPQAKKKLLDALTALPESMLGPRDVVARFDELSRAYDIEIIEHITRDALAAVEPMTKSLLVMAAELMKDFFESSELVQHARAATETGDAANTALSFDERLRIQCRLVNEIILIKKAIQKKS